MASAHGLSCNCSKNETQAPSPLDHHFDSSSQLPWLHLLQMACLLIYLNLLRTVWSRINTLDNSELHLASIENLRQC